MSDLRHASTFFLIFALVLILYGLWLLKSGDKAFMPLGVVHSIRGPEDVRRVGKIVAAIGLAIAAISAVLLLFVP